MRGPGRAPPPLTYMAAWAMLGPAALRLAPCPEHMNYLPFARPTIDEETIQGVVEVLRSGWVATGPIVRQFEDALSAYFGGRGCRTFTSATAALEAALQACGIGPGDEVIVPALSFVATANVVVRVGAVPVFVDVDRRTRNIDVERARAAVTVRTKAIMPVHFAGLPANLEAIGDLSRTHGLRVIEDARTRSAQPTTAARWEASVTSPVSASIRTRT